MSVMPSVQTRTNMHRILKLALYKMNNPPG